MPNAFNFAASPFDCLNPDEQRLVRDSVDVAYFPEGETILEVGSVPTHLFVVIKGFVTQFEGSEATTTYGPDDCFDGRGLVAGKVSSRFVAAEEVVAYQLAKQAVSDLIASNATFGALLFSDLSNKLSALSERKNQHELQSLTMSRVDEAFLRPAHFVDASTDILSVVKLFQAHTIERRYIAIAVVVIVISGFALLLQVGIRVAPVGWLVMAALGMVMTMVFGYVYISLFPRLRAHCLGSAWPSAAIVMNEIRRLVAVNLILALCTVVAAVFSRY